MFERLLNGQDRPKDVDVELAVELFFGRGFQRLELKDAFSRCAIDARSGSRLTKRSHGGLDHLRRPQAFRKFYPSEAGDSATRFSAQGRFARML